MACVGFAQIKGEALRVSQAVFLGDRHVITVGQQGRRGGAGLGFADYGLALARMPTGSWLARARPD